MAAHEPISRVFGRFFAFIAGLAIRSVAGGVRDRVPDDDRAHHLVKVFGKMADEQVQGYSSSF